jgi:hypothetical protein
MFRRLLTGAAVCLHCPGKSGSWQIGRRRGRLNREDAMRMELRRMTGAVIHEKEWPVHGRPLGEIIAEARDALASCYEGDKFSFWPKKEFYPEAPEEVRVLGADGAIIVKYDLVALLRETNRSLIGDRIG